MKFTLFGEGGLRAPLFVTSALKREDLIHLDTLYLMDNNAGNDLFSQFVRDQARREGLNEDRFVEYDYPSLGITHSLSFIGERAFISYQDEVPEPFYPDLIRQILPRWVMLMNLWKGKKLVEIIKAFAFGPAIAAIGMKAVAQRLTTIIGGLCEFDMSRITPKLIAKAALSGDEIACDIYEKAGFFLEVAASSICVSIGPLRIIIGGGVAHAGKLLLDPLERTMREGVHVMLVDQVEVVPALLGDNSGVIGAACWAANSLRIESL